jgi:hypothetical protein
MERLDFSSSCYYVIQKQLEGGLEMIDIKAKCDTLFIMRLQGQSQKPDNITAHWITLHENLLQNNNPPPQLGTSHTPT